MTHAITGEYSIDNVYKSFDNVIDKFDHKSIHLYQFIFAFRELSKFFNHLNVVFSFVAHDLVDKFNIIENLCKNNPKDYQTLQTMIEYETSKDDKIGCVTLLRLLRALQFIYFFLKRAIVTPTGSSSTKQVAWDVYKETLHKRHNKALQLSIWLATATIPKREVLHETLLRGEIEPNTADKCFPIIEIVYRNVYKLYEDNDLLELVPL
ncbi:unnamed protein product [Rotaria socialis]|uniref:Glycolipid transfer protein domain-containing protein n=1 Tax=Rotaria socialis TaxID=392032 RepID=A0A821LJQ8_9BILA|nr:unnamed protein product [Rotaria socialis]CAF3389101.1 unnamed protein product [Rotaria socialis]CAF3467838.1 unnamed protein product [Rotaria socialis]CAF3482475.1 unnamed protein product [Rotaria socialis]CAF3633902.1 unnamed protein product [Rotaria socialis]